MDTDMIYYVLDGHELQNDVQTTIQVFLANRHYTRTEEVTDAEITVKSEMKKGIASAMLYRRGEKVSEWSMDYDENALTDKEQKRIVKRTIYELLMAETGIRPQWGLLTGVRPAKLISILLEEG
ncbi:MAG: coproporphyrinogen dehydrogenase HemZ, partial [Anaerotignum sp.]|nr:coproporphyrinogen dehydrogenase HemZ [Anaerotignum sp.]